MGTVYDVIIVGGGPAGTAAALQLAQHDRALGDRTLLLDAALFPREKLCAGGVVRDADRLLAHLGVQSTGTSVPVHEIRGESAGGPYVHRGPNLFRVVRRFEFDHQLLAAAKRAGVRVSEGERVQRLSIEAGGVRVATDAGEHRARVVIGADGAKSVVRSSLVGPSLGRQMVALETVTWGYDDDEANTAVFDFRPVARGLRGYAWSFPSLRGEERWRVRGIGGPSWSTGTSLKTFFAESLAAQGVDLREYRYAGWSAPAYDPESPQSAPHTLLAGDAVGVEPWLGEGITSAIGSGILAAHVAAEALVSGRFDFSDYGERLRESAVGWRMLRNRDIADPFYEAVGKYGLDFIVPGEAS